MSDQGPPPIMSPRQGDPLQPAIIIYILMGVGIFVPFTALAGVVYAYVERGKDPVLDTHLSFLIRTFWWGFVWIIAGFILAFVLIGFLIWIAWIVWLAVRIITGIQLAQKQQPIQGVEVFGMKAV
ncbi:DUF4870 family protein [Gymnodinialimonas hymeniacidonis]|uniref:DUF4870 family protein n=1 Tax=Gymnodinialimonas hymeniacidonis TaxID=3126508 RepID=UPI0034C5FE1D